MTFNHCELDIAARTLGYRDYTDALWSARDIDGSPARARILSQLVPLRQGSPTFLTPSELARVSDAKKRLTAALVEDGVSLS
jgi:hypothetical protein